jgi:hypothetical protein
VFKLKKTEENRGPLVFLLTVFWIVALVPLGVIGKGDRVTAAVPELLYIGIPISAFIYLCLLPWCFKYLCYTGGLFKKDPKYWRTWPIAFWAIKCTAEAIAVGIVIVLFTIPVLLSGVPILGLRYLRTLGVVFTTPDGLALDKIKEIWESKDA